MTKALRHEYEVVPNLTILFRKFARHTTVGSAEDQRQVESLRAEATDMAAAVKQTVPTVTWNWLCKILHDEHLENLRLEEENRAKIRRYYGSGSPTADHLIADRQRTLELPEKTDE